MYRYHTIDQAIVDARVAQFREQTARYLSGALDDESYRPLRLQNGLYIQRHAPMLRIAIPYGSLSSQQLCRLADIADRYDRGYGHFTTRQNLQLNWPALETVPDILAELAEVQMHAIQTSGNCIRNVTTDPLAGVTPDEVIDPRVICECIRQWSTLHPEFAYLPRKFKIAVIASEIDRAAIEIHDIGIRIRRIGEALGFDLWVGGGLGRTPVIGRTLMTGLPLTELLNWLQAVLRVYNLAGRRDNKYKARIKILVNAMGLDAFRDAVEARYRVDRRESFVLQLEELQALQHAFSVALPDRPEQVSLDPSLAQFIASQTVPHQKPGYRAVYLSLKRPGVPPGDLTSAEMRVVAELANAYSQSDIRTTHDQNLVLPHVAEVDLEMVYRNLKAIGLAQTNRRLITDAIACPGLDFCSLANAPVLALADALHAEFASLSEQQAIGPLAIKMSGCMNACGHHHIGDIGILGVDKKGEHWYQLTLGGRDAAGIMLGERLGPAVPYDRVISTIRRLVNHFMAIRQAEETFAQAVQRVGVQPFQEVVYAMGE